MRVTLVFKCTFFPTILQLRGSATGCHQHFRFNIGQCILVLGNLQRFPFRLEGCFRVLWHGYRRSGHLILHGLRLIGGCKSVDENVSFANI